MREKRKAEEARRLILDRVVELVPSADAGQLLWLAQALQSVAGPEGPEGG